MVGYTFSAEEIRAAPLEVRRWIESRIARALGHKEGLNGSPSDIEIESLAECSVEEAAQVFRLISHILPAMQVFFELGRESHMSQDMLPLHCLNLEEMQRHVQFEDPRLLVECLAVIKQALHRVRNDSQASLFAADNQGRIFIHQTSYEAIRKLREQLHRAHSLSIPQEAHERGAFSRWGIEEKEPAMQPEYAFGTAPARPLE
jgi:hypothetical protein